MLPGAFRLSSAPRPPRIVSAVPFLGNDETLGARAPKPVLPGTACPPASASYQKLVVIETIWIYEAAAIGFGVVFALFCSEPFPLSWGFAG